MPLCVCVPVTFSGVDGTSDLVERLAREHLAIPRDRIVADVETYVSALKEQRLIDAQS